MMNHVLKRHPLALFYVRRQLTDPERSAPPHVESPGHESSDEEVDNIHGGDVTPTRKVDDRSRDTFRTNFEEELSTRHFIDDRTS